MRVNLVIPAYNESLIIEQSLTKLLDFCRQNLIDYDWQVLLVDNGSSDATGQICQNLASQNQQLKYLRIEQAGKGGAIRHGWQNSEADIYCFMDVDLATSLNSLPELLEVIKSGQAEVAIGNRFDRASKVERSIWRRIVSSIYRLIARLVIGTRISDLPCGFKAVSKSVRDEVLPSVIDQGWFFDSELVLRVEKLGWPIKAISVVWREVNPGGRRSQVSVVSLGFKYFSKLWALKKINNDKKIVAPFGGCWELGWD